MEVDSNLLRKTASAIRELNSRVEEQASQIDTLNKEAEAKDMVINMIRDGGLDPDDYETKVAEFLDGDLAVIKTAMQHVSSAPSFGTVDYEEAEKVAGIEADDPLTAYLLATAH